MSLWQKSKTDEVTCHIRHILNNDLITSDDKKYLQYISPHDDRNMLLPTSWLANNDNDSMSCSVTLIQNTCVKLSNIVIIAPTHLRTLSNGRVMSANGPKYQVLDNVFFFSLIRTLMELHGNFQLIWSAHAW